MEEGRKFDKAKLMYDLIEPLFLKEMAEVLTHGAEKYDIDNWMKVPDARMRYTNALLRHIEAYRAGEKNDPEWNVSHLAHAACNLMFLRWFDEKEK